MFFSSRRYPRCALSTARRTPTARRASRPATPTADGVRSRKGKALGVSRRRLGVCFECLPRARGQEPNAAAQSELMMSVIRRPLENPIPGRAQRRRPSLCRPAHFLRVLQRLILLASWHRRAHEERASATVRRRPRKKKRWSRTTRRPAIAGFFSTLYLGGSE